MLQALTTLLALSLSAPAAPTRVGSVLAPAGDELEQALAVFRKAAGGDLEARRAALEAVIALHDVGAVPDLESEFGRVSSDLRKERDELYHERYSLEHQRLVHERMKRSAERDDSLAKALEKQGERVSDLAEAVELSTKKIADLDAWYSALGEGLGRFFTALPDSKRKKAEKELWAEVTDATDLGRRLAAVETLGYAGGEGTAVALQALVDGLAAERTKLEHELPGELAELRKLEVRWQREMDQLGGRSSEASQQQYDRAKQRAAELQSRITRTGHLADAAAGAGGRALAREEPAAREKSVQKLLRAQAKSPEGARRRILLLLALSHAEPALQGVRACATSDKDPGARASAIDALAAAGDADSVTLFLERLASDPSWHVRSRAAAGLARMRSKEAIPILVERLGTEEGRMKSDVHDALVSLTGRDYRTNVELWRRFWRDEGEGFVVPPLADPAAGASEEAKNAVGVTFFGIETQSQRVLFVLDLSRSMTFSMVPRRHPNDEDPNDPDMPREDEISRLTAAKRALVTALGGIGDGAVFNLVFYATDVWTWQDRLVKMDPSMRSEAQRYVEALDANGGTNIYGALQMALDLAGATGGEWHEPAIDTIFFLSDGRPSIGVSTDPEEILAMVRERNAGAGIVIHTIGLSGAQDAYLLRSLAEQNGGTYVSR